MIIELFSNIKGVCSDLKGVIKFDDVRAMNLYDCLEAGASSYSRVLSPSSKKKPILAQGHLTNDPCLDERVT